ncbi:MAG: glycosyltransferase family 2 protein [Acidimicrobiia bacterium]
MLSVVIPVFNEADLVGETVHAVSAFLVATEPEFEIQVVENGSTDDTLAIATALAESIPQVRVQHLSDADYGAALRAGLLAARGDVVVNFDVDYYDFDFLTRAVAAIRAETPDAPDVVVGSKRAPGATDTRPWYRRLVTWTFTQLLHLLFGMRVSDTHGIKALRRRTVTPIAQRCLFGKDLFDTELVLRSERANLFVTEIPVSVIERRPSRTSILRRVPRTILGLLRLRIALLRNPM